ncbi:hypothetical protein SCLCIDRAFT_1220585, partial [Scleroderma citrinum Foug A]
MAFSQPFPLAASTHKIQQPTYSPHLAARLICPDCRDVNSLVAEEFSSGHLMFANDEGDDPSRVGAALDRSMEGVEQLDTIISFRNSGSGISRQLQPIGSWCDQFSLPMTISNIAKQLYKRSDEEKLLRGKPLEAVISTCIFIACRQAMCLECCNVVHHTDDSGPRIGPEKLLVWYRNHLDLPANVRYGRSPVSIAGGAIYLTCHLLGIQKLIRDISAVAGVTEGTIKSVYRYYYGEA